VALTASVIFSTILPLGFLAKEQVFDNERKKMKKEKLVYDDKDSTNQIGQKNVPKEKQSALPVLTDVFPVYTVPSEIRMRKCIEYEPRFRWSYGMLGSVEQKKVCAALSKLFVDDMDRHRSLRTHRLISNKLRQDGWVRLLKGFANSSRVNRELRIIWSEEDHRVVVHAICRHQNLYSVE